MILQEVCFDCQFQMFETKILYQKQFVKKSLLYFSIRHILYKKVLAQKVFYEINK